MAPVVSIDQYFDGSPIDRNIYALLIAANLLVLIGRRKLVASILRRNWPILLFVFYCAVSILWSDYPGVALKRWIKSLGDYMIVLIMLTERDRTAAVKQVLARVGLVLLPLSILFIKYYPELGRGYAQHWEGTQFLAGVAENKNLLGLICMVLGFAATWRVLHAWCLPRREFAKTLLVHGSLFAMAAWLLIKSDSKTSLACFVLTTALIAGHTFLKVARKRFVLHILVAAVVLSCFSVLFLGIGSGALESIGRDATLTGRTGIWEVLLKVPINPVVGTGFESFWLGERLRRLWAMRELYNININEAHNGYLEVYLNLGLVGLALIGTLMVTAYRNALRVLDQDPGVGRLWLGFLMIAVVYNFTEAGIRSTDLVWIVFLLVSTRVAVWAQAPASKTHANAKAFADFDVSIEAFGPRACQT
jgi:exopolysaccharide production protein ExoQ